MKFQSVNPNLKNYVNISLDINILETRLGEIEIEMESIVKFNTLGTDQGKNKLKIFLNSFSDIEKSLEIQIQFLIKNKLEIKPEINRCKVKINKLKKRFDLIIQIDKLQGLTKALKK